MTADEKKQFARELCRRWRGKFDAQELDRWAKAFAEVPFADVLDALTRFKDSSRFVPKIPEIRKLLSRTIARSQAAPADEGSFADVVRRLNPQWREAGDQEAVLRYWRACWCRYEPGAKSRIEAIRSRADGSSAAKAALAHAERVYEAGKYGIFIKCAYRLVGENTTFEEAKRLAGYVFETPEMFRLVLAELRGLAHVFD